MFEPGSRVSDCHKTWCTAFEPVSDTRSEQGVEDDHMNILCLGGRTVGLEVAWDLVQTFLAAEFSNAPRHLKRLAKVDAVESGRTAA